MAIFHAGNLDKWPLKHELGVFFSKLKNWVVSLKLSLSCAKIWYIVLHQQRAITRLRCGMLSHSIWPRSAQEGGVEPEKRESSSSKYSAKGRLSLWYHEPETWDLRGRKFFIRHKTLFTSHEWVVSWGTFSTKTYHKSRSKLITSPF